MRVALSEWSFHRISELELPVCRFCHQLSNKGLHRFFSAVSKIGDGHYWYAVLGLIFLVQGRGAIPVLQHAIGLGLVCHVLYKILKHKTARMRPFAFADSGFDLSVAPLDKYSFPSGHTLHAVTFALVVTAYVPIMGWILAPFAVLVAASRVVLGLHYPTDICAGALLGCLLAFLSFQI